jgi:hypothetical protein
MMMPGNEPQQTQVPDIAVPARVNKAMEFLSLLAGKRRRLPAATEHNIEVVDQDQLCSEEEATRDAALQLLAKYFDGTLSHDAWEDLRFKALRKRSEMGLNEGRVIGCIGCHPMRPDPSCLLCKGTGKILVQPLGSMPMGQQTNDENETGETTENE